MDGSGLALATSRAARSGGPSQGGPGAPRARDGCDHAGYLQPRGIESPAGRRAENRRAVGRLASLHAERVGEHPVDEIEAHGPRRADWRSAAGAPARRAPCAISCVPVRGGQKVKYVPLPRPALLRSVTQLAAQCPTAPSKRQRGIGLEQILLNRGHGARPPAKRISADKTIIRGLAPRDPALGPADTTVGGFRGTARGT